MSMHVPKSLLMGAVVAGSIGAAQAATFDLGVHPTTFLFAEADVGVGSFTDIYTFTVPTGYGFLGSVVASTGSAPDRSITDGRYFIVFAGNDGTFGTGDDAILPPSGFSFDSTTGGTFNASPSGAGLYAAVIGGTGAGTSGGHYTYTSFIGITQAVPAVPEPATVALMLGGLAGVVALARRRKTG